MGLLSDVPCGIVLDRAASIGQSMAIRIVLLACGFLDRDTLYFFAVYLGGSIIRPFAIFLLDCATPCSNSL